MRQIPNNFKLHIMKKVYLILTSFLLLILAFSIISFSSADADYEQARFINSTEAYRNYIDNNPNGVYVDEAKNRLARLQQTQAPEGMILVEGGTFKMGQPNPNVGGNKWSSDEQPVHEITLSSFYIDKYEVTNAQFCKFINAVGNKIEGDGKWLDIGDEDSKIVEEGGKFKPIPGFEDHPVLELNWYGAKAYAEWVGKRLPTEAEWEYAARGGNKSQGFKFAGSNIADDVAWYSDNSNNSTHPIGSKKPNELGIYDMSGNVWEWCSDWYQEDYYKSSAKKNPQGPESGKYRVLRGGAWVSIQQQIKTTSRDYGFRNDAFNLNGFRCVKDIK